MVRGQVIPRALEGALDELRLAALRGVVTAADWLVPRLRSVAARRLPPPAPLDWGTGVSVIVPERGSPDLLAEALGSVREAAARVGERVETLVVVNGVPRDDYRDLARDSMGVRWLHHPSPLGFASAIRRGVRAARYGAVYLLNSDMKLDAEALRHVLGWRRPHVFSVSSQIFFADPNRRREETGWADMRVRNGHLEMFHAEPEPGWQESEHARGHLYGGGGATLFHAGLLRRFTEARDAYHPFYFEDAEWGVRAWRAGYEALFCPRSIAWHRHRGTVSRYYSAEEIDRVVERNRLSFQLRNFPETAPSAELVARVAAADARTRRELTAPLALLDLARARARRAFLPCADAPLEWVRRKFHAAAPAARGPRVLVVSPYVVYPPAHGGAVRIAHLLKELSRTHRVILLSDEQGAYSRSSERFFDGLESVHLVGGRLELPHEVGRRGARIRTHSHGVLSRELARLVEVYGPSLVQVEYMELGALVRDKQRAVPWVLALHDVTLSERERSPEDAVELSLIDAHDAVITCSAEDAALLGARPVHVVPNGVVRSTHPYVSSAGRRAVLFMGPFRYSPNLEGIRLVLSRVYPELRRNVPGVELWLACGAGAASAAKKYDEFAQPGVRFLEPVEDPRPLLDAAAVTINPQYEIRGSSIKLIESLAAGRVCVSTVDGARGFRHAGFPNLIQVARVEDFLSPLTWLLSDEAARLALERPDPEIVGRHEWSAAAAELAGVYRSCLGERRAS